MGSGKSMCFSLYFKAGRGHEYLASSCRRTIRLHFLHDFRVEGNCMTDINLCYNGCHIASTLHSVNYRFTISCPPPPITFCRAAVQVSVLCDQPGTYATNIRTCKVPYRSRLVGFMTNLEHTPRIYALYGTSPFQVGSRHYQPGTPDENIMTAVLSIQLSRNETRLSFTNEVPRRTEGMDYTYPGEPSIPYNNGWNLYRPLLFAV